MISFPPQDTIGAGDSFIAGFLFALAKHRSVVQCIQHGVGPLRIPHSNLIHIIKYLYLLSV